MVVAGFSCLGPWVKAEVRPLHPFLHRRHRHAILHQVDRPLVWLLSRPARVEAQQRPRLKSRPREEPHLSDALPLPLSSSESQPALTHLNHLPVVGLGVEEEHVGR